MNAADINPERWRTKPLKHQIEDVRSIVSRDFYGLLNEMGTGKSKTVVDAAAELFLAGEIDSVIIMCPAQVKPVWLDREFGEPFLHGWVKFFIQEYSTYKTTLPGPHASLQYIVTSYEFIRQERRLLPLLAWTRGRKVLLVADEGSFIKSHKAAQTKAALRLRKYVKRAVLLNGTPIGNNHLDLYSQMEFLSSRILNVPNYWVFRNRIAELINKGDYKVIGRWKNLDWLAAAIKPHVIRRLKTDCLDLPPKLYTQMQIPLSPETWRIYREMKEQMVAWLSDSEQVVVQHAIVKLIRLSQITSGYVGGISSEDSLDPIPKVKEISDEKMKMLEDWVLERIAENPNFRCVIWCHFRDEQERVAQRLNKHVLRVFRIFGGQKTIEREEAVREFTGGALKGPVILIGQEQAGGMGLNLTKAHYVVYMSNGYSLMYRQQSEDRCHRQGQLNKVTYFDMIAVGPNGQPTIDRIIYRALRRKEDLAKLTTDQWRALLTEEAA